MSFTAEVKNELARVEPECKDCELAQLSAMLRVTGTLSWRGPGRYRLTVTTETGAVASTVIKLTRKDFGLQSRLTPRRSMLHKKRNYLIELPEQDGLEAALIKLGILEPGRGLVSGAPKQLLHKACCATSYVRAAFIAGGFVANPRGDFHLEIAVTGLELAEDLVKLIGDMGVTARLSHRRGAYAIYIKSFDGIVRLLKQLGAPHAAAYISEVREVKAVKNSINRKVNAELANSRRASSASVEQRELIARAEELIPAAELPPAVREFCRLRLTFPDYSLADLGELAHPPASKSAMNHRLLRLRALVEQAEEANSK